MSKRYRLSMPGTETSAPWLITGTAQEAIHASVTTLAGMGASWEPGRAEAAIMAIFATLTESQQDRALRAMGWEPEPSDVSPLPAPAPTPGELEYASWTVRPVTGCTRRESWGGCHCKTAGQRAVCMYRYPARGKP